MSPQANSPLAHFLKTVAAGATVPIDASGTFIYFKEGYTEFKCRLDHNAPFPVRGGFSYRLVEGDHFQRVELTNEGSESVQVEFYVGNGQIENERVIYTKDAPSVLSGGSTVIANNTNLLISRLPTGRHRKQLIVTNTHATASVDVYLSDGTTHTGTAIARVPANTSWTVFSSDRLAIRNTSGGNVTVLTAEVIYL